MVLERAHLFKLLLHSSASLQCDLHNLPQLLLLALAMRVKNLDKTRRRFSNGLRISCVQASQVKETIEALRVILLSQLPQRLSQIIERVKPDDFEE